MAVFYHLPSLESMGGWAREAVLAGGLLGGRAAVHAEGLRGCALARAGPGATSPPEAAT